MPHPILMPKPGQMTEECTILAWHKAEGEPVRKGDVLFEFETDKSNMDAEAFDEGILLRIVVAAGETAPVNSVCGWIGAAGEAIPETPGVRATTPPAPVPATPAVAAPAMAPVAVAPTPVAPAPSAPAPGNGTRMPISPRASRLAASLGISPASIVGSGPGGRIVERDVKAAATSASAAAPVAPSAFAPSAFAPSAFAAVESDDAEAPQPLSRMRRVIAARLTESVTTIPHFTVTVAIDMSKVMKLREELKAAGESLSVTDFVLQATAQTLVEFPDVNARTDGTSVWPRSRVHLGLAVSVPAGLVVPVIRDADRLPLREIHDRARALAERARAGSLTPDEMTGGTFSVSNLGMMGVEEFSAIINPGESGILAVSSVVPTPVAVGDGIAVRPIMRVTLSADHRLVDGETGARFLNALRRRLADVDAFRADLLNG